MNPLIQYKHIDLSYDGKTLFKDFNLQIEKGDKLLISGKSGVGKSSLIKMLLGFREFDSGEIQIIDRVLNPSDFRKFRSMFAYVNQDVTLGKGKIKDIFLNIESYKNNGFHYDENNGQIEDLMALFEFDKRLLDKSIEELSGGERQRLGIIIAIMLNRPVFLLDEITSALDRELKHIVVDYFSGCKETVISISHDEIWEACGVFRKVEW